MQSNFEREQKHKMPIHKKIPAYFHSSLTWKAIEWKYFQISSLFARKKKKMYCTLLCRPQTFCRAKGWRSDATATNTPLPETRCWNIQQCWSRSAAHYRHQWRSWNRCAGLWFLSTNWAASLSRHSSPWDVATRGLRTTINAARITSGSGAP